MPGCPTLAKQERKRSPKQAQKAPMLGRANGGVTACLAVVALRWGDVEQGKGGSSHTLRIQVTVLNGTSLWVSGQPSSQMLH